MTGQSTHDHAQHILELYTIIVHLSKGRTKTFYCCTCLNYGLNGLSYTAGNVIYIMSIVAVLEYGVTRRGWRRWRGKTLAREISLFLTLSVFPFSEKQGTIRHYAMPSSVSF